MQEDVVDDYSHAYIVLEGSLCGYFNKAFSERHSRGDDFRSWNSKKTNARGVTIDFGDLQVTYGKGAICGIDDFYSCSLSSSSRESRRHLKPLCRRRSVHSQESTTIIMLAKDSLDRVTERFGLVYERGVLSSTKETSRTDVAHLVLFSLLSEGARRALLQSATTRKLKAGEVLFSPDAERDSNATSFAIVRSGCLNIHCVEYGDTSTADLATTNSQSNTTAGSLNAANIATTTIPVPKGAVASLGRGQAFGDQMVALGHSHIWAFNPRRRRQVPMRFKVVAGDASTEVLFITREQYEQLMREDLLRLSYTPIFGAPHSSTPLPSIIDSRDTCQMTRYLLTDATLSKFFFQFPPIVLERLCHHMEIQHFESNDVLLEAGATINSVYIVVTGALHSHHFQGSESSRNTGNKALIHQTSARRVSLEQEVHFIPGDAFGARELMKRCYSSDAPVVADAGTTLLCVTRSTFERWVSPMRHNTIVKAGSILQPFVWSNSSPPASPRHSYSSSYSSSSVKVNRRQSGPSVISSAVVEPERGKARRLEEAAILLKRFGLFQTLPRFLLAQMLIQATLQRKNAGEELFREGDTHRALVVILSGFVSFYSIESMSATVDMLQKHPFCSYSTFSGSTTNPEDFVSERGAEDNSAMSPSAALKHRGAMHGVHIQTLPPRNAFRTGVLQESTVCPATVVAQTDCEYLVFDEKMYAKLLAEHAPAVDMSTYVSPSETSASPALNAGPGSVPQPALKAPAPMTDSQLGGIPPPHLLAYLEAARIPWLPLSAAKKTLLLRSMIHIRLAPGQRLIKHNDILKQLVFVVSGKLAVYVRENKEVTSILNASQRSVQSAALERSVASNYSTTSQQLYQERDGVDGISNRKALQRKIARIAEVETESEEKATSPNSRFTDFVLHAATQAKTRQSNKTEGQQTATPNPPVGARRSLHSVVNKVKFQRMTGDSSASNPAAEKKESTKALFMFHLCPGDIYGDEITAPVGTCRSVHDVYADTSLNGSSGGKETGKDRPHVPSPGTEILCLDRQILHSILAKTEEEAANELVGRSSNAKAKWQLASKKLFKRASQGAIDEAGGYIKLRKTPKLFDFFKNILNQRRFLTMGTLAHFPLLRDLSEDARRELCLNARFEALDRYTDAYKGNGDTNGSGNRFFLLLTGRINLVANGPNNHIVTQNASSTTSEHNLREVGAGEGFGEFAILVPEAPLCTAAIAAEPTKLLSIPSDMFTRHWPCTDDARGNIEYLRSQIPSFVSLDLERIAYLYHSFSFQTHIRGTNIFELQRGSSSTKEVYFIKEGTCCIRQHVTLVRRPNGDFRYEPCEDESGTGCSRANHPSQPKQAAKSSKILATVADVGVGHVFWIDNDHHPITLVATSAAVTIASISVDKLKAIVPRGLLVGLEDLSDQLRELYGQQFQLAKRVTATVMNEKMAAQSQRLPTIQPCAAQSADDLELSGGALSPRGSPLRKRLDNVTDNDLAEHTLHTDTVNAAYKVQHRVERYDIPSDVSVTTLVGSFLDRSQAGGDTKVVEDQSEWMISPKQDECSGAEVTTQPPAAYQNEEVSNQLRLNVKIPVAGHLNNDSPSFRNIAKATAASAEWRRRSMNSSRGGTGLSLAMEKVIGSNQEDSVIFEVDVRARVRAQMCTIESPMRAMRLEPSSTPVNSLGKYFADSPSPFARPGESYQRRHLGLLHYLPTPPSEGRTKPQHQKPAKPLRQNVKQTQLSSPSDAPSHAMLTRKQGFLTMLRVRNAVSFDGDGRDILDAILPGVHQGRRFFYALVDSELREYPDTIALNNLSQTPCLRRYALHNPRRQCAVSDVPVTAGQAEALVRQSFLLSIDDTTQLFFTAASAIDKHKWMTELNQARVLGGLQHPVSITVPSPRPSAATPPPSDPAALAAVVIDAFKGRRKSSSIKERKRSSVFVPNPKPEDTLHVEYRIS